VVRLDRHANGVTEISQPKAVPDLIELVSVAARERNRHPAFVAFGCPLAGARFQDEAERLETRLWGESGTKNRYENGEP
jgi:hypothetical protein